MLENYEDEDDLMELDETSLPTQQKEEKKRRLETELVNTFHYPHLEDDTLQSLESYVKWHHDHPGTTTPRNKRGNMSGLLDSGVVMISEENPKLVYTLSKLGKTKTLLPVQFRSKDVGKDGEFVKVTDKAHSYEHRLRLKESLDFEDPWWNKSVKDQVFVHHVHDQTDDSSWELDSVTAEFANQASHETKAKEREALKRAKADELAISSAWGKKPRVSKPVWEDPMERSKFTVDGVEALEDFLQLRSKNMKKR
jgi:hypothetical protein